MVINTHYLHEIRGHKKNSNFINRLIAYIYLMFSLVNAILMIMVSYFVEIASHPKLQLHRKNFVVKKLSDKDTDCADNYTR